MIAITDLLIQSLGKVWVSFSHNWPFLLFSVLISVGLRLYINPKKVSSFITRYRSVGVVGATAAAVTTPFCSCGTTAVILGMIASTIPWAPIVAFMVASPLTSPEELVYSAGLFGWPFAIAFFVSSIVLGLLGGALAEIFEKRGWLANQARFAVHAQAAPGSRAASSRAAGTKEAARVDGEAGCGCEAAHRPLSQPSLARDIRATRPVLAANPVLALETCCGPAIAAPAAQCGCSAASSALTQTASCGYGSRGIGTQQPVAEEPAQGAADEKDPNQPVTVRQWIEESYRTGKQLLLMFLGFAFIGYVLNGLIPAAWISAIFGKGNVYSIPLAATLGLPLYINTEGSLPLVRALIDGGMSQGAALAFLITGAGTSIGAMGGALTIARWRVIALVIGTLWVGAMGLGYAYDLLLALHLF